ncbi:MAG: hypothetical protein ACO1QR_13320 [Chthoniobacteraceae bacterium]
MNTPFELEASIAAWRAKFRSHDGIGEAQVQELESHLRDGIDDLHRGGLSLEESFLVARHRLGGESVADEIRRADPARLWAGRARWMFLGVLSYYALNSLTGAVGGIIQIATAFLAPGVDAVRIAGLLATVTSVSLFVWAIWQVARGRWQFTSIKSFAALQRPLPLALVAVGAVLLGKFIGIFETAAIVHGLAPQSYGEVHRTLAWYGLGEALMIPVALAFATDWARKAAEA